MSKEKPIAETPYPLNLKVIELTNGIMIANAPKRERSK
jgi:hypothetical protein